MRLSLGGFSTVTMTDRWFQELRAGRTFAGNWGQAGVAGQYAHLQIKNPAASGRQAIVAQIRIWRPTAGGIYLRRQDADLAGVAVALDNLLIGGAGSVSRMRIESNVAILGTGLTTIYVAANTPTVLWASWGPELSPGGGVLAVCADVNTTITGEFLANEV
jgi:hypothetical protein